MSRRLEDMIARYESNTFSASGADMTPNEARAVAELLTDAWAARYLDGVTVASALAEVRARDGGER